MIVELKAVEDLHPIHEVQLVNYLKATEIEVGLLINFGGKITIKRRVFSNLRKIAEGDTSNLGDTSTLLDPMVVEEIKEGALQ